MATTFSCFRTSPPILSSSLPTYPKPGPIHHKQPSSSSSYSSSSTWWTPLFGWSSDPDYINGSKTQLGQETSAQQEADRYISRRAGPRSKFGLGCFTEEKAKELRKKTAETSTFHDIMYHSAIASRLASDLSPRHSL